MSLEEVQTKRIASVHGADGPGYTTQLVDDWVTFMLERDIRRVLCLLSHERLTKYDDRDRPARFAGTRATSRLFIRP